MRSRCPIRYAVSSLRLSFGFYDIDMTSGACLRCMKCVCDLQLAILMYLLANVRCADLLHLNFDFLNRLSNFSTGAKISPTLKLMRPFRFSEVTAYFVEGFVL